jgi:hypothetical protein
MPKITEQQFDEELIALLHELEASQQLTALIMVLDDAWMALGDELHNEVVARIERNQDATPTVS